MRKSVYEHDSICGRQFMTKHGVKVHEAQCVECIQLYEKLREPPQKLSLTPEDCFSTETSKTANPAPKFIYGAKGIKKKIDRADFAAGLKQRQCPTCHKWMFIKHFRRHVIEAHEKGKR